MVLHNNSQLGDLLAQESHLLRGRSFSLSDLTKEDVAPAGGRSSAGALVSTALILSLRRRNLTLTHIHINCLHAHRFQCTNQRTG